MLLILQDVNFFLFPRFRNGDPPQGQEASFRSNIRLHHLLLSHILSWSDMCHQITGSRVFAAMQKGKSKEKYRFQRRRGGCGMR